VTERKWSIAVVQLSDSFRTTLSDLARDLRASVVAWSPDGSGQSIPAGTSVLIVLAGGTESASMDADVRSRRMCRSNRNGSPL